MRGDFIYVDKHKRALSNRIALESMVNFDAPQLQQVSRRDSSINQPRRPASYPPTGGSGGPYLRFYSYQGVNAAYGYASLPCDSVYNNGDNGNMYFNAYDSNGN